MMKPHIEFVEDSLWMCSSGEAPGGIQLGFGETAYMSYVNWFMNQLNHPTPEDIEPEDPLKSTYEYLASGKPMDLGIQANELWDLFEVTK